MLKQFSKYIQIAVLYVYIVSVIENASLSLSFFEPCQEEMCLRGNYVQRKPDQTVWNTFAVRF